MPGIPRAHTVGIWGFAAEMVTVSWRPWLFRVPDGFIKTVARCLRCFRCLRCLRCLRCFQRCFMRYVVNFCYSPECSGQFFHIRRCRLDSYTEPSLCVSWRPCRHKKQFSQTQFVGICLVIGNGKISKCFCCMVSRSILLRKRLEQQFETSGGDECDWLGPRNWSREVHWKMEDWSDWRTHQLSFLDLLLEGIG